MKSLKKILSIFAAFMMVIGLTMTSASAAEGDPSITITNAIVGDTYEAYKLFNATKSSSGSVAYTATASQKTTFGRIEGNPFNFIGAEDGSTFSVEVKKDPNTKQPLYTDAEVTSWLAKNERTILEGIEPLRAKVPSNGDSLTGPVSFEDVTSGYYYIKPQSASSKVVMVETTDITIQDKNDKGFDKTSDQSDENDKGFAGVGDYVKYTVTGTLYKGLTKYEVSDTMQNLIFVNNETDKNLVVKYALNDEEIPANGNYVLTPSGTNSFTLAFTSTFLNNIDGPTNIIVEYYGQVTKDAVTNNVATNDATLNYGHDNDVNSDSDKVELYNYNVTIQKYNGADGDNYLKDDGTLKSPLAGATFNLLVVGDNNSTTTVNLVKVDDSTWRLADASDTAFDNDVVTPNNGVVTIKGLDKDKTYKLQEIVAPDGFNLYEGLIDVDSSEITVDALTTTNPVANKTGSTLPSTGGMGTTMIYIAGAILMVGAAIIFVTNKRMKHE